MPLDIENMDTTEPMDDTPAPSGNIDDSGLMVAPPPMLSPVASFNRSSAASPMPPPPAGPCPTEIAFSFDTTGSMSSCLEEVQNHLKTIINRLFMDIPALKIGIFAHGDYCDAEHFYVTKSIDFTNDVNALFDFVTNCGGTGGGDYEECYELVLKKVREDLSWTAGTTKSLVMIGDAIPHPIGHGGNADLDWRDEVDRLHGELGVRVYAVQCMVEYNKEATPFWEELSKRSFGKYLEMNQFGTVIDLMMAICYREGGNPALFEAYEREVRAREGAKIGRELDMMFNTLRDGPAASASGSALPPTAPVAKVRPLIAKGVAAKSKKKQPATKVHAAARKYGPAARVPVPKATRTKKAKKDNVKHKPVHNLHRENVSASKFALNELRWCPWKLYCHQGFKDSKLFKTKRDVPAIYEVAVQPCDRAKRYVVFFSVTSGIPSGSNWDTYLMKSSRIRDQLKMVLGQPCKVFARRAPLPKVFKFDGQKYNNARELSRFIRGKYHYAWMTTKQSGVLSAGRDLVRRGVHLSKKLF